MKETLALFVAIKKTLERPPNDLGNVEALTLAEFNPSARSITAALLTLAVVLRERPQ